MAAKWLGLGQKGTGSIKDLDHRLTKNQMG